VSVCIGVLHKDFVILASDSRASSESGRYSDNQLKIIDIPNGGTLAITGSLGSGQKLARLLGQHSNPHDVPINEIPDEPPHCLYMSKDRKLFEIDSAFGVYDTLEGQHICIGSGCDIAECSIMKQLGKRSISTLDYKTCVKIVREAISDAIRLNLFCGGEVVIKSFKRKVD